MRYRLVLFALFCFLNVNAFAQIQTPATDRWTQEPYVERYTTMLFLVHPVMAREFRDYYGTRYPELTCEDCHGKDPENRRWKMPSAHLEALDPDALPEPGSEPEIDFMYDVVTPLFSRLIGLPMQSTEWPKGVSCFSCHVKRQR